MKRLVLVALVLVVFAPAALAQSNYVANLSGLNEVPPADLDGTGTAAITISGTTVVYNITVNNITNPIAQHIHSGAAGVNGPIVVNLPGVWAGSGTGPWTLSGSTTTTLVQANAIQGNPSAFYVNVHTNDFPGGAVRGQLTAGSEVPTASTWALLGMAVMLALAGVALIRRI